MEQEAKFETKYKINNLDVILKSPIIKIRNFNRRESSYLLQGGLKNISLKTLMSLLAIQGRD